ncbi:MAG: PAS domain S-box protein [Anaerolineae bacterium]|nr:PAS domain S-box protein [Anaerolineae bacterium]
MANSELFDKAWVQQQIIDNSPSGMMFLDALQPEFPIIYVNQAFERITGYPAAEIIGRNPRFLWGFDSQHEAFEEVWPVLHRGEAVTVVVQNHRKDGSLFWNELHLTPIHDQRGTVIQYLGTHTDVTLREEEVEYRALFEQSNDAVVIFDLHDRVKRANRRAAEMTGYSVEELEDMTFYTVTPVELQQSVLALAQNLKAGGHIAPFESRTRRKDGSLVDVEVNFELVRDDEGNPRHFQCIVRDITERKRALETEFELRLEKERTRLLTRFVQDAAHEFSTPLSTLHTGIYLISRSEDAERRALKAKQMERELDRINRLIESLLLLMKVESAEAANFLPLQLGELVQGQCQVVATNYPGGPSLRTQISPHLPSVLGDPYLVERAFYQLVDNAYRFTPEAGSVTVTMYGGDDQICVEISDTGTGIEAADLPHIFETFWRQDAVHTTPGFGLGLPIARRIVEQLGGTITVESMLAQGSCFRVTLPTMSEA